MDLRGPFLAVSLSNHSDPRDDRFCNDFEVRDGEGALLGHVVRAEEHHSYAFHLLDAERRLNASMIGNAELVRTEVEFVVRDANGTFLAKIDEHWRAGFLLNEYWAELKDQRDAVFASVPKGDADRAEFEVVVAGSAAAVLRRPQSVQYFFFSKLEYKWEITLLREGLDPRFAVLFAAKLIATNLIDEDHDDDDSGVSAYSRYGSTQHTLQNQQSNQQDQYDDSNQQNPNDSDLISNDDWDI